MKKLSLLMLVLSAVFSSFAGADDSHLGYTVVSVHLGGGSADDRATLDDLRVNNGTGLLLPRLSAVIAERGEVLLALEHVSGAYNELIYISERAGHGARLVGNRYIPLAGQEAAATECVTRETEFERRYQCYMSTVPDAAWPMFFYTQSYSLESDSLRHLLERLNETLSDIITGYDTPWINMHEFESRALEAAGYRTSVDQRFVDGGGLQVSLVTTLMRVDYNAPHFWSMNPDADPVAVAEVLKYYRGGLALEAGGLIYANYNVVCGSGDPYRLEAGQRDESGLRGPIIVTDTEWAPYVRTYPNGFVGDTCRHYLVATYPESFYEALETYGFRYDGTAWVH